MKKLTLKVGNKVIPSIPKEEMKKITGGGCDQTPTYGPPGNCDGAVYPTFCETYVWECIHFFDCNCVDWTCGGDDPSNPVWGIECHYG